MLDEKALVGKGVKEGGVARSFNCHPFGRLRAGSESFAQAQDKLREGSGVVGNSPYPDSSPVAQTDILVAMTALEPTGDRLSKDIAGLGE
jgi:hypothetical protein